MLVNAHGPKGLRFHFDGWSRWLCICNAEEWTLGQCGRVRGKVKNKDAAIETETRCGWLRRAQRAVKRV